MVWWRDLYRIWERPSPGGISFCGGHFAQCPLLALSGHACVRCTCLLLTQSRHSAPVVFQDYRATLRSPFNSPYPIFVSKV